MAYKTLLNNKNFRFLLLGQVLSSGGSALSSLGLLWFVSVEIGSPTLTGLLGAAWGIPSIFGFVAGAIADQYDRKKIMISADIISVVLLLFLAFAMSLHNISAYLKTYSAIFIVFCLSTAREFFETALFSILPSIVDKSNIVAANSFLGVSKQGALALFRGFGGGLLETVGVVGLLIIDAMSYLTSSFSMLFVRNEPGEAAAAKSGNSLRFHILTQGAKIMEGVHQMWRTHLIRDVIPWALPANVGYGAVLVLLPSWVHAQLGRSAAVYGLIISSGTLGFMFGSLITPLLARRYKASWIMGICTMVEAVFLFTFALVKEPTLAVILFASMNVFDGMSSPVFFSLLQTQMPQKYMGRIFGGVMTVLVLGQPAGMMIGGLLAGKVGLIVVFVTSALLIWIAGLRFLFTESLRIRLSS